MLPYLRGTPRSAPSIAGDAGSEASLAHRPALPAPQGPQTVPVRINDESAGWTRFFAPTSNEREASEI